MTVLRKVAPAGRSVCFSVLATFMGGMASAQATCEIDAQDLADTIAVKREICPPGTASIDEILRYYGFGADVDSDLNYLAAILARSAQSDTSISTAEAQRLAGIFAQNDSLRVGIQAVLLSNIFDEDDLGEWCTWRNQAELNFSAPEGAAKTVQETLSCFAVLE